MKKFTLISRTIVVIVVMTLLLLVTVIAGLILLFRQEHMDLYVKITLAAVVVLLAAGGVVFIKRWIIDPYQNYLLLFNRFNNKQIYREFIDSAGEVFPGMDKVLKRYDKLWGNQKITQKTKRQSEYLALQNQINPHFLYNTLEAIRGDALSVGMDNIANITEALATFFRYTITDTGSLVTIEDELDNVDNYFKIQKYRFGEKVDITYDIPDNEADILLMQLPKLTLQPIIENAIFHGLEKRSEAGTIVITIELVGNKVVIRINDNGVGIEEEALDTINYGLSHISLAYGAKDNKDKKGGIALNNVCRRIKLLFGEDYGLHVYSLIGVGTEVRITLPIVKKENGYAYEGRINRN
jgi:two-component system sensor histidine kinase YesM